MRKVRSPAGEQSDIEWKVAAVEELSETRKQRVSSSHAVCVGAGEKTLGAKQEHVVAVSERVVVCRRNFWSASGP